jgi:carbamoyl-phosphate synthase large subunit
VAFFAAHGIEATMLYKIHERREPNILTAFRAGEVDLAINVVDGHVRKEVDDDYAIRRYAVDHGIPLLTKIKQARLFIRAIEKDLECLPVLAWEEYVGR